MWALHFFTAVWLLHPAGEYGVHHNQNMSLIKNFSTSKHNQDDENQSKFINIFKGKTGQRY